ncbi:MAG: PKD domain-containing protein, partial [Nanoarchaeota archaeon]
MVVFLVLVLPVLSLSFDSNKTVAGKDRLIDGSLVFQKGIYEKNSKVKLTLDGNLAEKTISELISCTGSCKEVSSNSYSYTGATATEISSTNFLTGISIKRGSTISIDAKFNISNGDSSYPETPMIDVGDDGIIEWKFQGRAPTSIDWNVNSYQGPSINDAGATELNLDPSGTCQQIFLNKSDTFKVASLLRKSVANPPSLGVYIHGKETTVESCGTLQSTFSSVECTISIPTPIESGDYKICLTSPSQGIVLAVNDSAVNSQGHRCTASSCNKIQNTDYAIQVKSSNFITTLQDSLEYFESNTKGGYFKDAVAVFLQKCIYNDDNCIIPINVSTLNGNNVKLHSLSYTETLSDGQAYNRNRFLLGVKGEGVSGNYDLSSDMKIPLSIFNLKGSNLGNFTLTAEHNSNKITADIEIISAPTASFNVSNQLAPVATPILFDASNSKSDSPLTYSWNFGDNTSSSTKTTSHSYLLAGVYRAELTATDQNNVSDKKSLQIEIFSERANNELIQNAITRLQTIKDKLALPATNSLFTGLSIDKKIDESISELSASTTMTEQQVNDILNSVPTSITSLNKISVSPYLSIEQTNNLYGFETESYKTTLQEVNSRIQKEVTADLVSLAYPKMQETFILVKKTLTTPQEIRDATIIELIPVSIAPSSDSIVFTESFPEITRLQDYQSAKFTIPLLRDSFTFYYKLESNNLNQVKDTILVLMPNDLSPSLIPFNCGDGICNPAEDIISCPEDCTEEEKTSGFPWVAYLLTMFSVIGVGFIIYKFKIYNKLKIDKWIEPFLSGFKKSPFKSGIELAKVRTYIKSALDKGFTEEQIIDSLLEKGWSKEQVDYA